MIERVRRRGAAAAKGSTSPLQGAIARRAFSLALALPAGALVALWAPADARAEGAGDAAARAIVAAVKAARAPTERAQVNMVVLGEGRAPEKRRLEVLTRAESGDERLLVRFSEPAEVKGVALLTLQQAEGEDLQHLYMPSRKRVKTLARTDRRGLFVGTDFAFEDLRFEDLDKHAYAIVGEEVVAGERCRLIAATPCDEDEAAGSGYARRVLVIPFDRPVLLQSRHHDKETGDVAKVIHYAEFKDVGGFARPHRVTVEHAKRRSRTIAVFVDLVADPSLDARAFTTWALEHGG